MDMGEVSGLYKEVFISGHGGGIGQAGQTLSLHLHFFPKATLRLELQSTLPRPACTFLLSRSTITVVVASAVPHLLVTWSVTVFVAIGENFITEVVGTPLPLNGGCATHLYVDPPIDFVPITREESERIPIDSG